MEMLKRIEPSTAAAMDFGRFAQAVKKIVSLSGIVNCAERLEIASVRLQANFCETPEVGNAFGHGEPAQDDFPFTNTLSANHEPIGMIDNCFNPQ